MLEFAPWAVAVAAAWAAAAALLRSRPMLAGMAAGLVFLSVCVSGATIAHADAREAVRVRVHDAPGSATGSGSWAYEAGPGVIRAAEGSRAAAKLVGMDVGDRITLRGDGWTRRLCVSAEASGSGKHGADYMVRVKRSDGSLLVLFLDSAIELP